MGASRRHPINWLVGALLAIITPSGCSSISRPALPESYGIYVETEAGLTKLSGKKVPLGGNIMQAFGGIAGSSGIECRELKSFVVYLQQLPVESIRLARLSFQRRAEVPGLLKNVPVTVDLWTPSRNIEINIAPAEGKTDMYFVRPAKNLEKGLYALYFGSFGSLSSPSEIVFDVAVGSARDFPSQADKQERSRKTARQEADWLLASMNRIFNDDNLGQLDEIYRPGGVPLSGDSRRSFIEGMRTLRNSAGSMVSSRIVSGQVANAGDAATYGLETTYQRSGVQREEMRIQRVGGAFYIAALK